MNERQVARAGGGVPGGCNNVRRHGDPIGSICKGREAARRQCLQEFLKSCLKETDWV